MLVSVICEMIVVLILVTYVYLINYMLVELAEVLWEMVLLPALKSKNGFAIAIAFYFWFVMTVSILLFMEGLSSFLHALRLHW